MSEARQREIFPFLVNDEVPCIIIAKGNECPPILMEIAKEREFPIFVTEVSTGRVSIELTSILDEALAPETLIHGCLLYTSKISDEDVSKINTSNLRNMESFVSQETHLFHDSIKNNLLIAKLDASDEEIVEACKKAAIHDFILTLPKGYDTPVEMCIRDSLIIYQNVL